MSNSPYPDHTAWHMRRALRLAEKGRGWTLPNPLVGALIVKNGQRIGEGFHTAYGKPHAEVEALTSCNESPKGATLFVTLEPCAHTGKTLPCTEAILKSGITKVVIATLDPSKKVNGKGVEILKKAGIEVEIGVLREEATELNRDFFTFHQKKRPFITIKAALSLDGKIAIERGKETQITGHKSQLYLHSLRHQHQAILVGAGTVLSDDPHLGARLVEGRDPLRIILQGSRKLPKSAQVFRDSNFLVLKNQPIENILKTLHEMDVVSVLVEGGSTVFSAFLDAGCVDQVKLFIAPLFLGEGALPFAKIKKLLKLKRIKLQDLGQDLLLTALIEEPTYSQINKETATAESKELKKKIGITQSGKTKNGKTHKPN